MTKSQIVRKEAQNFKKAFVFMQLYIALNLLFNICSKFLQKNQPPETFSSMEICLGRSTVGVILMYALLKHNKMKVYDNNDPNIKYLQLRGLSGLFFFASMTYCVGHGAVSTVFLSQNLSPMISSIASYYLFKEELGKYDILSLIIGFLGVILILLPHNDNSGEHLEMSALNMILIVTLPF